MTGGSYSVPEVGALLKALAAGKRVAEAGTGVGNGAAAMAETAREVVTVDNDAGRVARARERFASHDNVQVLEGDALEALALLAPFDLVFLDSPPKRESAQHADELLALVEPGGLFVLDDLTPGYAGPDGVREFWLRDPRVAGAEVQVTPEMSVIVASRRTR